MPSVTCPECGTKIGPDDNAFTDADRRLLCEGCRVADEEGASTVIIADPDSVFVFHAGDFAAYGEDIDERDVPRACRTYHRTDGWRGYYTTALDGFEVLADGWTTGWPDETVQRKVALNDLMEAVSSGTLRPPARLAITADPTTNVFSTGLTVHCQPADRAAIEAWLETTPLPLPALAEAMR